MTPITLNIPDDLADRLRDHQGDLRHILEIGLRRLRIESDPMSAGLEDAINQLADARTPQEVLAVRANPCLTARVAALLEKNESEGLTPAEQVEWDRYEFIEHIIRLAKATAVSQAAR